MNLRLHKCVSTQRFKSIPDILQHSFMSILILGAVLYVLFNSLYCGLFPFFCVRLDSNISNEQYNRILSVFFAMNLSFFTLVPVLVTHIQTVLCYYEKKQKFKRAIDYQRMLTDDYVKAFFLGAQF